MYLGSVESCLRAGASTHCAKLVLVTPCWSKNRKKLRNPEAINWVCPAL